MRKNKRKNLQRLNNELPWTDDTPAYPDIKQTNTDLTWRTECVRYIHGYLRLALKRGAQAQAQVHSVSCARERENVCVGECVGERELNPPAPFRPL